MAAESQSEPSDPRPWSAVERALLLLLLATIAGLGVLWWNRSGGWRDPAVIVRDGPAGPYANKLDPNTASRQSLARLPGVGELRAKAIEDYRAATAPALAAPGGQVRPVFRKPEDLLAVKNFGPATVARIAPYLAFPSPATSREDH